MKEEMPDQPSQETISAQAIQDAVEIAKKVSLVDVFSLGFNASNRPEITGGKRLGLRWSSQAQGFADSENDAIGVIVSFEMHAIPEGTEDPGVNVGLVLQLVYERPDIAQFEENAIQAFAQLNGTYNAWPYWREYVQNAVARMGLPTLIVPVYRIQSEAENDDPPTTAGIDSAS
ncbi:MAG: hypothetical protein GVY16_12230 [Planctomycetes bacterium]|jgi:preprotein translocase subunit SecB|nr:hypothetical protein [Planctomycetota bacterium]